MYTGRTEEEHGAARWHDEAGDDHASDSSCWCCCTLCELHSPHYEAGMAAIYAAAAAGLKRQGKVDP